MADVVRRLRPKAFIIENVRGLTRASFANYFQYILCDFQPRSRPWGNEDIVVFLPRLEKIKTSGKRSGLCYDIVR